MKKLSVSMLKKFADKAGISLSDTENKKELTIDQLALFAASVQEHCADKCLKIVMKHQKIEGSRASGMKAGALECYQELSA